MSGLALALLLGWPGNPEGLLTKLPPAPLAVYAVAWRRELVTPKEVFPFEEGGVAVDPGSGIAVCGTRDGWLHAVRQDGQILWEFKTRGPFPAPPAIAGDSVYAGSSDGHVYALALADGKLRWSYDAGEEMGTRPAVAAGVVYVMSLQDTLIALDGKTGQWKWLHRREARGIDRGYTIRGAASALVRGSSVFGAYSDGFVAALDATNGQVRWERQVAPSGEYTDVDSLWLEGKRLYAAAYSGEVLALDPDTGVTLWSVRAPRASRVTSTGALVVAEGASQLLGLAPGNGQPLWSVPLEGSPGGAPVAAGRWVLVPAQEGGLRFVEPATGRTLRIFDGGNGVTGEPAVNGRRVYVLSNGGSLYALDLE